MGPGGGAGRPARPFRLLVCMHPRAVLEKTHLPIRPNPSQCLSGRAARTDIGVVREPWTTEVFQDWLRSEFRPENETAGRAARTDIGVVREPWTTEVFQDGLRSEFRPENETAGRAARTDIGVVREPWTTEVFQDGLRSEFRPENETAGRAARPYPKGVKSSSRGRRRRREMRSPTGPASYPSQSPPEWASVRGSAA